MISWVDEPLARQRRWVEMQTCSFAQLKLDLLPNGGWVFEDGATAISTLSFSLGSRLTLLLSHAALTLGGR